MKHEELQEVLRLHSLWLRGSGKGSRADLRDAKLRGTCLSPHANPNGDAIEFNREGQFVVGYRTRRTAGDWQTYRDGKEYAADVFSTCEHTECHPGLYLWPTLEMAKSWSNGEIIKVLTRKNLCIEPEQSGGASGSASLKPFDSLVVRHMNKYPKYPYMTHTAACVIASRCDRVDLTLFHMSRTLWLMRFAVPYAFAHEECKPMSIHGSRLGLGVVFNSLPKSMNL